MSSYDGPRHDTVEDYILANAPRQAKEKPVFQSLCSLLVVVFAIAALATDEISDGDIDVEFTSEQEDVDFDCGWNHVLFYFSDSSPPSRSSSSSTSISSDSVQSFHKLSSSRASSSSMRSALAQEEPPITPTDDSTETLTYSDNKLCDAFREFDEAWCDDMVAAGIVWLVCGVFCILCSVGAIASVWWAKSKASLLYLFLQGVSLLMAMIAVFFWMRESRCDEFEDLEGNDAHQVTMEVSVGASMILMYVALGFDLFAFMISVFYVCCKTNHDELKFDYNFDFQHDAEELRRKAGLTEDPKNPDLQGVGVVGDVEVVGTAGFVGVSGSDSAADETPKQKKGYAQVNEEENE